MSPRFQGQPGACVPRSSNLGRVPAGLPALGKGTERDQNATSAALIRFYFCNRRLRLGLGGSQRKAGPQDAAAFVVATPQASWSPPLVPAPDVPAPSRAQTAREIEPQLHFAFCSPFREILRGGQRENVKRQAVIYDWRVVLWHQMVGLSGWATSPKLPSFLNVTPTGSCVAVTNRTTP